LYRFLVACCLLPALRGPVVFISQQSMMNVKSKLQRRRAAGGVATTSFGVGAMSQEQACETPYLVSLSGDPMLHLAVKVFVPAASTLRIGRGRWEVGAGAGPRPGAEGEIVDDDNDLQLEGLGIEPSHCSVRHCQDTGHVVLTVVRGAACFVNGAEVLARDSSGDEAGLILRGGDRVVLGVCSHVFVFIDPRCAEEDVPVKVDDSNPVASSGQVAPGARSSIAAQESLTSHDQAIREVILGRTETLREKEVRLATMVSALFFSLFPFSVCALIGVNVYLNAINSRHYCVDCQPVVGPQAAALVRGPPGRVAQGRTRGLLHRLRHVYHIGSVF
jgi:hypothetical protein